MAMEQAVECSEKTMTINENISPFINGQYIASDSDTWVDVINPANNQHLYKIPTGSAEDANRAVVAARRNFCRGDWCDQPPSAKKAILHRFADLIAGQAAMLDQLDALEMGKPIGLTRFNAEGAAHHIRFMAEAIDKVSSSLLTTDKTTVVVQDLMPRGVVVAVTPWNFPTFNVALKIGPALAAGNSVILKPSEISAQSAFVLAELALEAGLPSGTLNVVPGLGHTVGKALALHMDVDMVSFTGSTAVGKLMLQYSGQSNMKEVATECGGKSPQIVFDDGLDLDVVADGIAAGILTNQGQVCSAGSRVLVQASLLEPLVTKICARMETIKVGDPLDSKTTYGPLVSAAHLSRVLGYINNATQDGADLVYGGNRLLESTGGNFLEPAVFVNVDPASALAQDEIFGPVLSVMPFETEDEAIALANSTCYGLATFVWSNRMTTAMKVAKQIPTGIMIINATTPLGEGPGSALSVEPYGQSGTGVEGGIPGLKRFMRQQLIWTNHG